MTTVYAVFKTAVYRHECAGVFSTLELARKTADRCASLGDGHHSFEVVPFEIDAPPNMAENARRYEDADDIVEPSPVYDARYQGPTRKRYDKIA